MKPLSEIKQRLEQLPEFSGFNFREPEETNLYGTKSVEPEKYRNASKDLIRAGSFYSLFVAHMYPGEKREFFYLIFCRKGEMREYRHKNFYEVELDKTFTSGKTVDLLINNLKEKL